MRLRIVGLGVGGSALAWMASMQGMDTEGYDASSSYTKPCGDAVTLRPWIERLLSELDVVKTAVKRYVVQVEGETVAEAEFSGPNWYIIDKHTMISRLRMLAGRAGARLVLGSKASCSPCPSDCICVDARGPYAHPRSTWVYAARIIAAPRDPWDPETALLDFYPHRRGLFWLFPASDSGRLVNLGAGFLSAGVRDSLRRARSLARQVLGGFEEIDTRAAPIAVYSRPSLGSPGRPRIGESAGLVIATAGEGNRPALESARNLADALSEGSPEAYHQIYEHRSRSLLSEAEASRLALGLAARMPWLLRVMTQGSPGFWKDYLAARITWERMVSHALTALARISDLS